jgi:hypothetical protein
MRRHGGGPRGIRCSSRGAVLRLHRGPTTTPASMQAATPADACTQRLSDKAAALHKSMR